MRGEIVDERLDLTQGKITEKLVKMSLPIMGTSFIQMAYNMIDMIWVLLFLTQGAFWAMKLQKAN